MYLLSGLLMVGSAWTAWLAQVKELSGSTISAALLAVVGAAGLLLPGYLRRKTDLREGLLKWLRGPYGPLLPLGMLVVLCSFFLIIQPDAELALVFGPVLAAFWAAGAGISLLAARQPERLKASGQTRAGGVVVVSALLLYGILLIPAKLPGLLDGLPWDTPLEFGLALLGIPLALTFAGRFLTRKWVVVSLLALLTLKIGCMLLLPQPGLVVRAYQDGAAFKAGIWERSYASFFSSEYTQLKKEA